MLHQSRCIRFIGPLALLTASLSLQAFGGSPAPAPGRPETRVKEPQTVPLASVTTLLDGRCDDFADALRLEVMLEPDLAASLALQHDGSLLSACLSAPADAFEAMQGLALIVRPVGERQPGVEADAGGFAFVLALPEEDLTTLAWDASSHAWQPKTSLDPHWDAAMVLESDSSGGEFEVKLAAFDLGPAGSPFEVAVASLSDTSAREASLSEGHFTHPRRWIPVTLEDARAESNNSVNALRKNWYPDADGDQYGAANAAPYVSIRQPPGYVLDHSDCDDDDPNVYPGAAEQCNGKDDDCDTVIDDGLVFKDYYPDADDDDYGSSSSTAVRACAPPSGKVEDHRDCNDSNAKINPAATEICNSMDDDCDGQVDEGVQVTYYRDADGDKYPTQSVSQQGCSPSTGFISPRSDGKWDCNDSNAAINPGATDAVCDGIDSNCDNVQPICTVTVTVSNGLLHIVDDDYPADPDEKDVPLSGTASVSEGGTATVLDTKGCADEVGVRVLVTATMLNSSGQIQWSIQAWLWEDTSGTCGGSDQDGYSTWTETMSRNQSKDWSSSVKNTADGGDFGDIRMTLGVK